MATVPFEYECNKSSGFVMDPNQHKCVGYITSLGGFSMPGGLAQDLKVSPPFNRQITYTNVQSSGVGTIQVVGVLEKFSWAGGVGNALQFDFWVSQANAFQIKSLQQTTLKSTIVDPLGWWIADYDHETKTWYEKCFPMSTATITGTLADKDNPELNVDVKGEPAKDGIDVMVSKISMNVVPGANRVYSLQVATSSTRKATKQWGLVVGSLASANYKNA